MYFVKTSKILALIMLISTYSFSQSMGNANTEEEFRRLMGEGIRSKQNANYAQALEYFTKAEPLSKALPLKDALSVKTNIAIVYSLLSNFGEALGYYQQAVTVAEKLGSAKEIAAALNNIGILYAWEKSNKDALEYFKKAYDVAVSKKIEGFITVQIAVNISHMYNLKGQYKTSQKYLMEVEDIETTHAGKQMWSTNYAESLMLEGNIAAAEKIVTQLLKDPQLDCYMCTTELLSKIYAKQNKEELAILYARKSLSHAANFTEKIDLYDHLSKMFFDAKNYSMAFKYRDSVLAAKDSMAAKINRGLYESNKIKFKIHEYQNESERYKEKQEADRVLFIVCIAFGAITFFLVYKTLKNSITKQKQGKSIAEKQQRIISLELEKRNDQNLLLEQELREKETNALLEQERLKNEIDTRNRQLSAKALNISGRNQLIEDIIESFANNPKLKMDADLSRHIRDLKKHLKTDDEWDSFIAHFEQVNNNMLKRLQALYPSLTANDLRFIAYLYMNLSYKEIAVILNITVDACAKRKERISSKLNIPKGLSLYSFLSGI